MTSRTPLRKDIDFYLENGNIVLTRAYHLKRGRCCGSNCRHCPYEQSRKLQKTPIKAQTE